MAVNSVLLDKRVRAAVAAAPDVTDDTIVAALVADCRTPQPILLADLAVWLAQGGRTTRLRRTLASPALAAAIAAGGLPSPDTADQLADAIEYFSSPHNGQLDTQDPTIGAKTFALLQLMRAVNGADGTLGMSAGEVAEFLALGGGVAWGPNSVQAADVAASRLRIARADLAGELGQRAINAAAAWVNDHLNVAAADPNATLPAWADFLASLPQA